MSTSPPLQQITTSARALLEQGKSDEAWDYFVLALEAVLDRNRDLEMLVAKLRRERLGQKSEKLDAGQLALLFEAMQQQPAEEPVDGEAETRDDAALDAEVEAAKQSDEGPHGRARKEGPGWASENVERRVHRVKVPSARRKCKACKKPLALIGQEVTRRLEYVPAHFVEHEHQLEKLACSRCKDGVITAPAPAQVLPRSAADASVLAHVVVSKHADHVPLHRLSRIYARSGVHVPVSTLCDWVAGVGNLIAPLAAQLEKRVLGATVVRTDATGLKVLDATSPDNIVRGTIWAYVGDDKDVLFKYTETGEGMTGPWKLLAGRTGYVQADAASVHDRIFDGRAASATEVGCWAHARRRFVALMETDCRVAYPLRLIRRMYRIEDLANARRCNVDGRTELRKERTAPVLEKLHRWLVTTHASEPPSSDLARAAKYALNQWQALTRFVDDGRLALDNNICEQQLRDIALGRKNYLFAGSHDAARRAAAIYSLTRTCAQHGVAPLPYFTELLRRLANGWHVNRLDELLPHAIKLP